MILNSFVPDRRADAALAAQEGSSVIELYVSPYRTFFA